MQAETKVMPQVAHLSTFLRANEAAGKARDTVENYEGVLRRLARYLKRRGMDVETMNRAGLIEYMCDVHAQCSPPFANQQAAVLRVFFRWLYETGFRPDNPAPAVCRFVKIREKPIESLTLEEARLLLGVMPKVETARFGLYRAAFLVSLLLETGMRVGEALRLTLPDIDLAENRIMVNAQKTHSHRIIPLTAALRPRLLEYLRRRETFLRAKGFPETDLLFVSERGLPWTPTSAGRGVHTIAKLAGIRRRVWPHLLRHTWARLSLSPGLAPLPAVMYAGGWTNLKTVHKYTFLTVNQVAQVQELSSPLTSVAKMDSAMLPDA